jgi:hypothetical protein
MQTFRNSEVLKSAASSQPDHVDSGAQPARAGTQRVQRRFSQINGHEAGIIL